MPPQTQSAPGFGPPEDAQGFGPPELTTEESEHARQLKPAQPLTTILPSPSRIDQMLAPSDMTGNDPNTLRGYMKTWGEALKGAGAGIKALLFTPPPGTKNNPVIWNPAEQFSKDWEGIKSLVSQGKENPNYVAGELAGPALVTHTLSKLLTPAGTAAKLTRGSGGAAGDVEPVVKDLRSITGDVNPKTGAKFGNPNTIGDFLDQVSAAESKLNKEYANALGPHAKDPGPVTPNGTFPVSDAILKLKEKIGDTTPQDKAARAYIDQTAALFQKPLTLDELNRQRIAANARLYSFENKSDVAQYSASGSNAGTSVDRAIANTVRDVVYPEMDRLTGKPSGYFRDLQNRVGNLFRLESDSKDYAKAMHQKSMIEKGMTRWERARPGASVSQRGALHMYIPNIPAWMSPDDPEAAANSAIRSAYGVHQRFAPPPEALSLPVSSLLGYLKNQSAKPIPPNHPLAQSPIQ